MGSDGGGEFVAVFSSVYLFFSYRLIVSEEPISSFKVFKGLR